MSTVLFTQTVSFLQKLVTAYQTGLPTHEILVSSFLLCTVDNRAPPSTNTMQFFYRFLESQKAQNKRLKILRKQLNASEMCFIHYFCRGQSPYRNFLSKQYGYRSTDVAVIFKTCQLCFSQLQAHAFWYTVLCRLLKQPPQHFAISVRITSVLRKNFHVARSVFCDSFAPPRRLSP